MTASEKVMLGFVAAFLSSALWPSLPSISLLVVIICILIFSILCKLSALFTGFIVGVLWASFCAYYYLNWSIDGHYYNQNVIVEGTVSSIVNSASIKNDTHSPMVETKTPSLNKAETENIGRENTKFSFELSRLGNKQLLASPQIRLSWYGASYNVKEGQIYRLFIRLKRPVGLANPDGYNYQQWLVSKNIVGLGYVVDSPSNQLIENAVSLRQDLIDQLHTYSLDNIKWIMALSYGERSLIEQSDWKLLQRTGTAHLFAISGMHLGIVFGFVLLILKASARLYYSCIASFTPPTDLRLPLYLTAILICTGYAQLAGFEVPVMRALLALLLWSLLVFLKRYWRGYSIFLSLLSIFFVVFPFSILSLSFWFSFGAVVLIMFFLWRFPYPSKGKAIDKVMHVLKLQLFMSMATVPIVLASFDTISGSAFVANIIMIPIVTCLLVPFCLIASSMTLLGINASWVYFTVDKIIGFSIYLLKELDEFTQSIVKAFVDGVSDSGHDGAIVEPKFLGLISDFTHIDISALFLSPLFLLTCFFALLPSWHKKRPLVSLLLATSILTFYVNQLPKADEDDWHVYFFDVGQGTAIVIESNEHYMLYDTGIGNARFSMASTVLLPFFKARDINSLQYFVLSHFDQDHAGGRYVIENHFSIEHLLSPDNTCNVANAKDYQLSKLNIEVLWPLLPVEGEENNDSCVLKISGYTGNKQFSVLLSGDIEKSAEAQIVKLYAGTTTLHADVLLAAHHGSKTSSSLEFIEAVKAKHVVFTSGFANRWQFPNNEVVERFEQSMNRLTDESLLTTGTDGRIRISFTQGEIVVSKYRDDEYKRWYFKAL